MRCILPILVLLFGFSSCSKSLENSNHSLKPYTFTFDTLMIDAKEELLFMEVGFFGATLSNDEKHLYKLGGMTPKVEVINIEDFKLEKILEFDSEGPNGIGEFISDIKVNTTGELVLSSYERLGVFDEEGKKIFDISPITLDFDDLERGEQLYPFTILSDDKKKLFTQIESNTNGFVYLGIIDTESKTLKKLKIPDFEYAKKFRFSFMTGRSGAINPTGPSMQFLNNEILFTNKYFNTISRYDMKSDSMINISYDPVLTADRKIGNYLIDHGSFESFQDEIVKTEKEVSFGKLLWDRNSRVYYRFSQIGISTFDDKGKEKVETYQVYLTVLDDAFNPIGVEKVDALNKMPEHVFVKNSKIWLDFNINDELAVVQMGIHSK
ncbi:DUF4221 domain-containing protein [Belliella sp. R4-6]|uniref:DUF4221 domain-containing protein n=1 Tax=Belliella alkalica TaxID=1730871 RepID=A0ABS9VEM3_9BACT|nr:DUF4221 family protein [Belliella alkalica]MCH7414892.1 DUF4221 domain-containing protein [Belliella alkalica]